MGHTQSQKSSVPTLLLQFLTKMIVYFPYVEYIGTNSLSSKIGGNNKSISAAHTRLCGFSAGPKIKDIYDYSIKTIYLIDTILGL